MKLTTTFNLLRAASACDSGYRKLAKSLGGVTAYGAMTEINLLTILESNGFNDAVWCLRATAESSDVTKRLIAADFAESVLHIFESKRPGDDRPRKAIQAARDFANGAITAEELRVARADATAAYATAAADADAAAADAYAAAAAADAADAAAAYAAAAADADAADAYAAAATADAAAATAARQKQKYLMCDILIKHLS